MNDNIIPADFFRFYFKLVLQRIHSLAFATMICTFLVLGRGEFFVSFVFPLFFFLWPFYLIDFVSIRKGGKKKIIIRLIQVIKLNLLHLCCHVSLAFLKISIFIFELVLKFCLKSIKKMKTCKS